MDYGETPARRTMALVVDGRAARARGEATARDAGLMLIAANDIGATLDDRALAADLLLVEVDGDPGAPYDALMHMVARRARGGQAVVVAIRPELIDATVAAIGDAPVAILCAARPSDRIATVQAALAGGELRLREDGPDREERLRAISGELARIADRLVAAVDPGLAAGDPPLPPAPPAGPGEPRTTPVEADDFRRILRRRRLRELYLGDGLFSDPAWDMLLDLAAARLEVRPVAVSSLCIAAAVPATTALRWIQTLTQRGMLVRQPDPQDGRRVFVTLSPATADAMGAYVRTAYARDAA